MLFRIVSISSGIVCEFRLSLVDPAIAMFECVKTRMSDAVTMMRFM